MKLKIIVSYTGLVIGKSIKRSFYRLIGLLIGLTLIVGNGSAYAADPTLPTTTFGTGVQVTPSDAWTYYSGLGINSPVRTTTDEDVIKLANALDKDPDKIYAFVHDNIETLPMFGLKAGARGAIIDKAGTAFDQSQLMVELLRASGFTASYQLGTITLTGTQFNDWLGVNDANVASQFLANGGIPYTISSSGSVINSVTMMHMWVITTIGGTSYAFDPSMKSRLVKAGINLDTAMSFNAGNLLAAATTGAQTATDNATARVRGMNRAATQAQLLGFSQNLLAYLKSNMPEAELEDVVGGATIIPVATTPVRQAALSYQTLSFSNFVNDVPDSFKTKVVINFYYNGGTQNQTFTFNVDEIYGEQLVFKPLPTKAPLENEQFRFYRDDAPLTAWLIGVVPAPNISIFHPYASNSGTYMDHLVLVTSPAHGSLQILLGFGKTSRDYGSWQEKRHSPADEEILRLYGLSGDPIYSAQGIQTATKRRMGAAFLAQMNESSQLISSIGNAKIQIHDAVGFVSTVAFPGLALHGGIAATGFQIGMEPNISITAVDNLASTQQKVGRTFSTLSATLEGSIASQIGDSPYIATTSSRFDWALDGNSMLDNQWLFLANSTNWTWVNSQLLKDYEGQSLVSDLAARYINDGYKLILPKSSNIGPGPDIYKYCQYTDATNAGEYTYSGPHLDGYITKYVYEDPDGHETPPDWVGEMPPGWKIVPVYVPVYSYTSYTEYIPGVRRFCTLPGPDRGGAFVALRADNSSMAHIVNKAYGFAKGGGGTNVAEVDPTYVFDKPEATKGHQFSSKATASDVDLKSGVLTYSPAPDLTVGQGEYPYSLSFQRTYRSGGGKTDINHDYSNSQEPLATFYLENGWTSNLDHFIKNDSDGLAALGRDNPMAATNTIATIRAIYALSDDGSSDLDFLEKQIAASITANWWVEGINGNVMNITQGDSSQGFVRLADGSWAPPRGTYANLSVTNTRDLRTPSVGPAWWAYNQICVKRTDKNGVESYYGPWDSAYTVCTPPAKVNGKGAHNKHVITFRHQKFPNGITVDQDTTGIWNSLGRRINVARGNNSLGESYIVSDASNPSRQVTLNLTYPNVASDYNVGLPLLTVTDVFGKVWNYETTHNTSSTPYGFEIRAPLSPNAPIIHFTFANSWGQVDSLTDANNHTTSFNLASYRVGQVVDPLMLKTTVFFDRFGQPVKTVDPLGLATIKTYDSMRRLLVTTLPEGNGSQDYYDLRSNSVRQRSFAKPGSGLSDINSYTTYAEAASAIDCAAIITCNKPLSSTDANGNITNYSWSAATGDLTQILQPPVFSPVDGVNVRPQTDLTYTIMAGISFLTGKTHKITNAVSVATSYGYDAANKYVFKSVINDVGGINQTTSANFDVSGNLVSVDGPRTDVDDISYYSFDLGRRLVNSVGVDPDAAGALTRQETRYLYNDNGWMYRAEIGTTSDITGAVANFNPKNYAITSFDAIGNPVKQMSYDGTNAILTLSQSTYDADDRSICSATRMNPDVFATTTVDACTLGTPSASFGGDRITSTHYDNGGRIDYVKQAVGSVDERFYARFSYSQNGQKLTETDANTNLTALSYDGFDRLIRLTYPSTVAGSGVVNALDYESYSYDNNGNRTGFRRRNTQSYSYQYDALNRQTLKTRSDNTGLNVASQYDLLGRMLNASFANGSGSIINTYDKLGRVTSTQDVFGRTIGYQYNEGSTRKLLSFPDAVTQSYGYDAADRLTSTTLGSGTIEFNYDNFGRVTTVSRGNTAPTNVGYDTLDRVTSLSHDLALTANDINWGWGYNPASQIVNRTTSNTTYSYANAAALVISKSYDGLNQDAGIAALAGGYDPNGNLSNEGVGGRTFGYDIDNHLISTTGGTAPLSLSYDPMGRLSAYSAGSVTTQFLYDGTNLIGEYVGAGMTQRYAHGLGTDQPLVAFSGMTTGTGALKYLYADRQGSIIALADSSGTVTQKYSYGPWGEPKDGAGNTTWGGSRFRYTGQTVLPETQLYYYKARLYDPNYGRFLQTDPIGSKDDLDLYAYTGGDPVNRADPSGEDARISLYRYSVSKNSSYPKHGFVVITDTETGEVWISRGGPSKKEFRAFIKSGIQGNLKIRAETTKAEESYDAQVIVKENKVVEVRDGEILIKGVTGQEVADKAKEYTDAINSANTNYDLEHNSNSVAFGQFENLTGKKLEPDVAMPGSQTRLPTKLVPKPRACIPRRGSACH